MANKMRLKARFRLRWMQGCTVSRKKTSSHLFDQEENKFPSIRSGRKQVIHLFDSGRKTVGAIISTACGNDIENGLHGFI